MLPQYYEIVIEYNNLAIIHKINFDEYNFFKNNFEYVYHTKSGKKYPLSKNSILCIDTLVVDDDNLYELLDELIEEGFCDKDNIKWRTMK